MKPWRAITVSLATLALSGPAWSGAPGVGHVTTSGSSEPRIFGPEVDSPVEEVDTTYRFVGLRLRGIIIPEFYMHLFASGGTTVGVPAVGPELTIRKNEFEYVLSLMYASY